MQKAAFGQSAKPCYASSNKEQAGEAAMDRRLFTTGLAAGTLSYFSGDKIGHAVPNNQANDVDEEVLEFLRRLDLGPLGDLAENLPRLRGAATRGLPGFHRRLSLIETPAFLPGTTMPTHGTSFVINLDRDLITWDGITLRPPTPDNPDFRFEGNVRLSGDPALVVQRVNTDVTVRNGASVAIGGLIHDLPTIGSEEDLRTPILGDLPVVGYLFRRRSSTAFRRNLLVFITPRIVDPDG
jgi:type II/III secretion system protein